MSRPTSTRRRLSLLASSSLAVASLMAGVGGGVVALAPTQALAANECGDPSGNAGAPDVFFCTGAYPTGIDYTATVDGDLVLLLVDTVTVPDGGIRLVGGAGEGLGLSTVTGIVDNGDINITNIGGLGIDLSGTAANVTLNIFETDAGDGTPFVSGTSGGIRLRTNGGFDSELNIQAGTVDGGNGWGLSSVANGGGDATVDFGATNVSGTEGVRAQAATGMASVTGQGTVTTTGAGYGVFVGGGVGGSTADISGTVTSADIGVRVQATGGGTATATVGDITAVGVGLEISAINGGDALILGTGNVSGSTGITATASAVTGGNVSVTTGGTVTGTAGDGITATSNWDGNTTVDSTAGLVTATGNGVAVTVLDGDGDITVGDVNAGFYGVVGSATGDGAISVTVNGAVVGGVSDGVDIDTTTGTATLTIAAGGSVDTGGVFTYGADVDTQGGNIIATVDGDVLGGGIGLDVNAGAGTVNLTGSGSIDGSAYSAVEASTVDGDLTINFTGTMAGDLDGVNADVTGAGDGDVTVGGITVGRDGVNLTVATGTATVTTNGAIVAGGTGVIASAGGNVTVNVNDDVTATVSGITASSTAGSSTVTVAAGVTIDPEDYGISDVAATDATVITGDSVSIVIDNSTDNDTIAVGVFAQSGAAADTGALDPSVEVTLGTNNSITLLPGGVTDGGAGIQAENNGGGTGSVSVIVGDGTTIDAQGDNTVGVYAGATGAGDVSVTLGTGHSWVYAGDGTDGAGNFDTSAGIRAQSGGGNITIDSNSNVQGASAGSIDGLGIYATTSGAGTVDITTGADSYTWGTDYGIGVNVGDGAVTIETNGMVQADNAEAIFVNGGAGAISVTNNAFVSSGGSIAIELDGTGDITVVSNASVTGVGGIDVDGDAGLVDITVATGVTVNGTTGVGIAADTSTGGINLDLTGSVTATGVGVSLTTVDGAVDVDLLGGSVTGSSGIVVSATGTGTVDITSGAAGTITGNAGDGVSATTDSGGIFIDLLGDVSGTANGVIAASNSGTITILGSTGTTTGGTGAGMSATTGGTGNATILNFGNTSGTVGIAVNVTGSGNAGVGGNTTGDSITGTAGDAIQVASTTGTATVILTGPNAGLLSATGGDGIDVSSTTGDISVTAGWNTTATGYGVLANSAGGDVVINNTAAASIAGGTGGIRAITTGLGIIDIDTTGAVSATGGVGIFADTNGTGTVTIDTLADVSGTTAGIAAQGEGIVNVTSSGGVITGDTGIFTDAGLSTTVNNSDTINAVGGAGIDATAVNAVTILNSGAIPGTAFGGIVGESTGATAADVFINNSGAIGSLGNNVSLVGIGGSITNAGSSGDIQIITNANVYSGVFGVIATNAGTGNVDIDVGPLGPVTVRGAAGAGVFTAITNGASTGTVTVDVSDSSTIIGGVAGITAFNAGTGASTVTVGSGVLIDPNDYGIIMVGAGEQNVVVGDNVTIDIDNTDADDTATGILAVSGLAADVAANDPAVEITIGNNLDLFVDDGAGGEADGGAGVLAVTGGTASSEITAGSLFGVTIEGDNVVGVGASSDDGDVTINIAGGAIITHAGDGTDSAGNFTGSRGIGVISTGGDISVTTGALISVSNGTLDASGIYATTTGAGTVTLTSNSVVFSSDVGFETTSVDGDIIVNQNGGTTAGNVGIQAEATGAGSVTVNSTASVTATAFDGINAQSATGAVTVNTVAGTTITSGDDGITALVNGGAANVTVTNNAAIVANTSSGGGYGIYAWNSGTGDTNVGNTGAIDGSAVYGIVAGANTGTVDVDNSGAIGSSGNPVTQDGIYGYVAGGAGNVSITNFATGVIWASDQGIYAFTGGTGGIGVSNAAAIGGSATNGIFAQAADGAVTVVNAGAIGSNGNNVGSDGIYAEVQSGVHTLFVQNNGAPIWADASGIIANNDGAGILTVLNSGVVNAGASGISADSSGGVSTVTNSAAITAGNDGIQSFNTGAGTITVTNSAAISASQDGIDTSADSGATIITNSAAITTANDTGIEADSGAGAITVNNNAGGVISAQGDGIRAQASGAGAVTVTTAATVTSNTADGIQAASAGGTIVVTNNAAVTASLNGILTTNSGAATTTVNANANVTSGGVPATAAINAGTTGTGLVDVNVANGVTLNGNNGSGIRTASNGGAVSVDIGAGGAATVVRGNGTGATSWVLDLNNAAGGTTTVNIASNATVRSHDATVTGYDDLAIRGIGGSVVVNNAGRLNGRVNFAGLTGNVVFNNTSGLSWHTTGASVFSGGADVLNNTATGAIFTNSGGVATSFDFGAGADTFTQAGLLVVGEPAQGAATLTITGLEAWNNSGSIAFGSSATTLAGANSDGFINDKIVSTGTTFTGSGNSRLFMDVNLGAVTQGSCAALTAADCLDLTGGSTAGSTTIRFNDVSGNPFGAFNPTGIVVVDVSGAGATSATNFSLLAGQPYWRADLNSADGVLDKGLFFYDLTLDGKKHLLVGLPDGEAFEFTTMGQAAQAAWYTTTGTWFDRQADLRDQLDETEAGAGIWMKITGSAADRDLINSYDLFGVTYSFDTSYDQQTIAVVGGIDFVGASTQDGQWVIGGMIGYVDSDVNFDASPTTASMEGLVIGAYGTFVNKGWFVDGVIAGNVMDLDYQAPTLAAAPNNIFASEVNSWGGQVEGGYSFALGGTGFFEPLASLSYVQTEIDAIDVPGAIIDWDDQTSLRGSLGARIGANAAMDTFDAKFSVTGRIWNEFEGENELTIHSAGPDLGLTDDFSGSFGEISGSVNLFSNKAAFSAFLNAGVKFKDDYQSTDATLGFRWRW